MKKNSFIFMILIFLIFSSCSLKYDTKKVSQDATPEFIFEKPLFKRIEDGNKTVIINADKIEKYNKDSTFYANNVYFETFDEEEQTLSKGFSGLLFANMDAQLFELYDKINLYSKDFEANFSANALRWNGKTEQLTGSKNDTVRIEKNDTILYGTGFSASTVTNTFNFSGTVTGEIEEK